MNCLQRYVEVDIQLIIVLLCNCKKDAVQNVIQQKYLIPQQV